MSDKDKPKVDFNLDAAVKEATGEEFRFTWKGKVWTLPPASEAPAEIVNDAASKTQFELGLEMIRSLMGDRYDEFIKGATITALHKLMEAYLDDSGVTVGESEASTS